MTSLKTTAVAMLLSVFASTASADFDINWQGSVQRLPGNPVSDRWQLGIVPYNGMSISSWCASRFGNGYECVDEMIAQNWTRLQRISCGGENWLCAGNGYLFPAGTYAVQPFTRESPDEESLQGYLEQRFDRQGNELLSQFEAIQAIQAQLLADNTTMLNNQSTLMAANLAQSTALIGLQAEVGTVKDEVNQVATTVATVKDDFDQFKTAVTANNTILNLLAADMGLTGTAGVPDSDNSQPTQTATPPAPAVGPNPSPAVTATPTASQPTWGQVTWDTFVDWSVPISIGVIGVVLWFFFIKKNHSKASILGSPKLPVRTGGVQNIVVKHGGSQFDFDLTAKKKIDDVWYYTWSLDKPPSAANKADGYFAVTDMAQLKDFVLWAGDEGLFSHQ